VDLLAGGTGDEGDLRAVNARARCDAVRRGGDAARKGDEAVGVLRIALIRLVGTVAGAMDDGEDGMLLEDVARIGDVIGLEAAAGL
jgi:hypothetical protein